MATEVVSALVVPTLQLEGLPETLQHLADTLYQTYWVYKRDLVTHTVCEDTVRTLRSTLQQLREAGYTATIYTHLIHIYPINMIEVQVWKGDQLRGLTAKIPKEVMEDIYFYLRDRRDYAASLKYKKLEKYYDAAMQRLLLTWPVVSIDENRRQLKLGEEENGKQRSN